MKTKRIGIDGLIKKLYIANVEGGFEYPTDYKLNFFFLKFCKCCKKPSISNKISVFDGKTVYICPKCGGRRIMFVDSLRRTKNFNVFLLVVALIMACSLAISVGVSSPDKDDYTEPYPESQSLSDYEQSCKDVFEHYINGIYISSKEKLYFVKGDFDSETANFDDSGRRKPVTYYADEENELVWLGFVMQHVDSGEITVWYPVEIEDN